MRSSLRDMTTENLMSVRMTSFTARRHSGPYTGTQFLMLYTFHLQAGIDLASHKIRYALMYVVHKYIRNGVDGTNIFFLRFGE